MIGVIVGAAAVVYACIPFGRPVRWEVPDGYRGYYGLQEANPACPPLANDGLEIVARIPASGCGCTSDELPNLWRSNHTVAVGPDGTRIDGDIQDIFYAGIPRQMTFPLPVLIHFVGTRDALDSAANGPPHDLEQRCGWTTG